jgi:hypothetical protein
MFYDHEIHHRQLCVTVSGFIILFYYYCILIVKDTLKIVKKMKKHDGEK